MTAASERRLAAILAADVVGYSRLMEVDEKGTHDRLRALRKELIEPPIAAHHGRIVKLTGDGALVEFPSVVDAVECAVEVQKAVAERNGGLPDEQQLWFRIGINIGDIILEEGDIYGDGVNVASRLEGLAEPGGICVARNVYNQVKNKLAFGFEPMGKHQVKNITEPVEVYRVLAEPGAVTRAIGLKRVGTPGWRWTGLAAAAAAVVLTAGAVEWWSWKDIASEENANQQAEADPVEAAALPLPDKPSIAVLPFDNLSGEERYERLADGITEDIITDLSRFRDLFVIARNSTFFYKSNPADVRQIARELGVQYVLEGSLQAQEERVRITAQLVDATTGNHVWSDRYERPLNDVFAVQDEVTQAIAAQLGGLDSSIARAGRDLARRKPPENLQAYDYYLLGVETKEHFTKDDNKKAQELFRKALELDPNFARGYIGLAHTYNMEIEMRFSDSYQQSTDNWLASVTEAIRLDPYDGEARVLLGWYYLYLNDFNRALAEIDHAVQLNPSNADILGFVSLMMNRAGQPERALALAEQAIRLNPHHPDWYYGNLRDSYFYNRRFEEAIAATKSRVHPNPFLDPLFRAMSYAELGRERDAAREVAGFLAAYPDHSAEKFLSETGTYARDVELNLFLDGHRKAALPLCATEDQLAKYSDMKHLNMCEQQRASG